MRDERTRNDSTYPTISSMQNLVSDLGDISLTRPDTHFDARNEDNLIVSKITGVLPGEDTNDVVVKAQLDLKRDTTARDSNIRNSTNNTAISCDTDRYISIKSNGNKIADILEDEVNQGCTLSTSKRLNLVATQPITLYHNSAGGLINMKYTDSGNTTTPG
jgi:hypothetical protein